MHKLNFSSAHYVSVERNEFAGLYIQDDFGEMISISIMDHRYPFPIDLDM